jgi:hypothetical protein
MKRNDILKLFDELNKLGYSMNLAFDSNGTIRWSFYQVPDILELSEHLDISLSFKKLKLAGIASQYAQATVDNLTIYVFPKGDKFNGCTIVSETVTVPEETIPEHTETRQKVVCAPLQ